MTEAIAHMHAVAWPFSRCPHGWFLLWRQSFFKLLLPSSLITNMDGFYFVARGQILISSGRFYSSHSRNARLPSARRRVHEMEIGSSLEKMKHKLHSSPQCLWPPTPVPPHCVSGQRRDRQTGPAEPEAGVWNPSSLLTQPPPSASKEAQGPPRSNSDSSTGAQKGPA